ncbi:MAG: type II toxin-antitoxin system VapC family toxin, partial [Acidobacteria bacterium]|nr:type II toxin-antitoxin system VapC family toxin [Acidobacteriota bacterium]
MQFVIVDTDVVSYSFKRDSRSALYEPHLRGKHLCLSFMTIAELDRWTITHNWGARKQQEL